MSVSASQLSSNMRQLSQEPLVAAASLAHQKGVITPNNEFFVRNHFPIPQINGQDWALNVTGLVNNPMRLCYSDLGNFQCTELVCLLECAGNSRAAVQPAVEGLLWDNGGVSTANWRGIPVKALLDQAGLKSGVKEILFRGADFGKERHAGEKEMGYAMSLPLEHALRPDTMLAFEMNGQPLPPEHGFPLRLVVPGWYGMASVKWVTSVEAIDYAFHGFHQSEYYVFQQEGAATDEPKERVTQIRVKSLIAEPGRGAALPVGRNEVRGMAWSGTGPVTRVEVSSDNGRIWQEAQLSQSVSRYGWQEWTWQWETAQPGYHVLRCRATDAQGNVQPERAPWNFRGFANNSIQGVPVQVR